MTEQTFSDPIAQGYYRQGESEISTTQSADEVLQKADALAQQDSHTNLMHAACYYLAAAHFLETHDPAKPPTRTTRPATNCSNWTNSFMLRAPSHKRARGLNRPRAMEPPPQRNSTFSMAPSVPTRERTIVSRRRVNWTRLNPPTSKNAMRGSPGPRCRGSIPWPSWPGKQQVTTAPVFLGGPPGYWGRSCYSACSTKSFSACSGCSR